MDNNASPTPDPDATTRRRSGRVVRAPAKFTPEATSQSTNSKRKRGDQDDDDDDDDDEPENAENEAPGSDQEMSDEPDNESDEDHPAPRSRKKASQTSRAKKHSSKKPKINGSQPLRPARITHAAKSLPSRPKKTVRIDDVVKNGIGLYADLFGKSGESTKSIAGEWLKNYQNDEAVALTDLVNCILQSAGCDQLITEDDVRDPENITGRLADLQSVYQEQQITDYPLISRTKHTRSFRDILIAFFQDLVLAMHEGSFMYKDESLIDNLHAWLASMSSSSLRPFRHTATTISLSVQTGLVTVANKLDYRLSHPNAKGKSAAGTQRDVEKTNNNRKVCTEAIQSFFDTVFVHRYRDVDPKIRTECVEALGNWIISLPTIFLEPGYLRYLGWMLSDTNAPTRHEVLKQLTRVFKRDASQLGHFIDRFRPRLVEMACKDLDISVRVAAIGVIDVLRDQDLLEAEEIDAIGKLIFDNELRIRKAVVGFFVACTKGAINEKVNELGASDIREEIPSANDEPPPPLDEPRFDWVDLKCLAETLAIYDNQIEDEHQSGQILGLDVAVDLLESVVPDTRISLASQVLYDKVDEIKRWTVLAQYLLFDHTTSSKSKSKGNNTMIAFKKAVAPTPAEESILLDVLSSAVKSSLAHPSEHDRAKKKHHSAKEKEEDVSISPEETAGELVTVIPELLSKFGAEPDTAAIVLRLAHFLNLELFRQLRQDANKYEKLLDEIVTQFNRHDDKRVLSEAKTALLHSRQYEELEELTDSKLSTLWENVVTALHNFDKTCELSSRGNLAESPLRELSTVLLKISKLASISDCVDVLEAEGDSSESTATPVIQILANIVHRGKYEPLDDQDIDDLEDEVVSFAIKACQFYFMWKTRGYSNLLSSTGGSISDAELDRLSLLRQTFRRHLIETLSSRAAIDQLRLFATGSLCDLHLTFATLRPTIERLRPSSSSASQSTEGDKYKALIQEIEPGLVGELIAIFDGAERQYAKKAKKDKTLNEPAEDEDPMADDEDEEDEEEDESLSEEERFAAELKAEKALCELTAKYVLVITARLVDNRGSQAGKLRRRLLRNQNKLGHNFKEVVAYLDEEKLAERTRKKVVSAHPATSAKPQKAQLSEATVVPEDEDDIFDDTPPPEEGSREDLRRKGLLEEDPIEDDDENEDEEAERPAHESDDEVIGD
ncbi:hypothetical protein F66182_2016 [Fusarium sp. NRRL 66182]|nr:hypothetical protein F66182_2016 [Fusarium sp. NRRL 66182]